VSTRPRLLTARFVLVVASGVCYFLALGVVLPNVPRYVKHVLGGSSVEVGIAVGTLFVGAVILRPIAGRIGDRYGRRILVIGGAATVAVSLFGYALAHSIVALVAARLLTGLGEAAFFVGAATMITDLAPVERRGEAISYWSVSVYTGFAFGPAIGEIVQRAYGYTTTWFVAGALAVGAVLLGLCTREAPRAAYAGEKTPLIHRRALVPGIVLFCGLIATAGFGAFIPLYSPDVGIENVAIIFFVFGGLVLLIRMIGARLPDILGGVRAATIALIATAIGMGIIAVWASALGLFAGVLVFGLGSAFLYPAILLLALENSRISERGAVIGTVSSCFDLSQGVGSLIVGGAAAVIGYRGAFGVSAVAALIGLVLLWRVVVPIRHRIAVTEDLG
jgi:MFS family permease